MVPIAHLCPLKKGAGIDLFEAHTSFVPWWGGGSSQKIQLQLACPHHHTRYVQSVVFTFVLIHPIQGLRICFWICWTQLLDPFLGKPELDFPLIQDLWGTCAATPYLAFHYVYHCTTLASTCAWWKLLYGLNLFTQEGHNIPLTLGVPSSHQVPVDHHHLLSWDLRPWPQRGVALAIACYRLTSCIYYSVAKTYTLFFYKNQ